MVDNKNLKEIAVVMRLKYVEKEQVFGFEPQKIIRGNYYETMELFTDKEGKSYPHMSSLIESDIVENFIKYKDVEFYCIRTNIESLFKDNDEEQIKEFEDLLWEECNKYQYRIGMYAATGDYLIVCKEPESNKLLQFHDADSDLYNYDDFDYEDELFDDLDDDYEESLPYAKDIKNDKNKISYDFNPLELANNIKKKVFGQDEAIDRIVQSVWSNYQNIDTEEEYNKENILVIGASGVGKTEIFRQINKNIPNIVVHIADLSSVTESGYVGDSLTDLLEGLLMKCIETKNGYQYINKEKAEHAIIILDEFDKIAIRGSHGDIDVGQRPVQEELLKIIEGKELVLKIKLNGLEQKVPINTSKMTFVCCGAFADIVKPSVSKEIGFGKNITKNTENRTYQEITSEDIKKYGFINEIVGRIPVIVKLNDLDLDIFIKIIKDSDKSLFKKKLEILKSRVQQVEIEETLYQELANQAMEKKNGARGIDAIGANLFYPIIREVIYNPDIEYTYAKLDQETAKDNKKYILKRKKEEKVGNQ